MGQTFSSFYFQFAKRNLRFYFLTNWYLYWRQCEKMTIFNTGVNILLKVKEDIFWLIRKSWLYYLTNLSFNFLHRSNSFVICHPFNEIFLLFYFFLNILTKIILWDGEFNLAWLAKLWSERLGLLFNLNQWYSNIELRELEYNFTFSESTEF